MAKKWQNASWNLVFDAGFALIIFYSVPSNYLNNIHTNQPSNQYCHGSDIEIEPWTVI